MALRATHVESGTEIDLDNPDDLFTQSLIGELHRKCARGVLECREHDEHGVRHGIWVYLQCRNGQWLLCHHDTNQVHSSAGGKSPDHQEQQDYWQQAGEAAGHGADQEVVYPGIRVDVTITGPAATVGVEVQRSGLAVDSAMQRTAKARKAGLVSIWCAEEFRHPAWAYRVPHVETNLFHRGTRQGSWWVVSGPRIVEAARCTPFNFDRCPDTGRRQCGKYHPKLSPLLGLRVDDVAEGAPAGGLVPLETRGRKRFRYLVAPEHRSLYEELTAERPPPQGGGSDSRRDPFGPCRREVNPAGRDRLVVQEFPDNEDLPWELWLRLARGYDR